MVANTLENWAIRDVGDRPHKLFLHFFESPSRSSARTARSSACAPSAPQLDGTGNVKGTGEFNDWDVQAVYRAVGYLSDRTRPSCPFDDRLGHRPQRGRPRVIDGRRGEHLAVDVRHRLDQARPGRPDRPHQGRRQRDRRQPARRPRQRLSAARRRRPSRTPSIDVPRGQRASRTPPGRAGTAWTPHETRARRAARAASA